MKTKFVKVSVEDKKPPLDKDVFITNGLHQRFTAYLNKYGNWIIAGWKTPGNIKYWLDEVPDNEDDLKQIVSNINLQKVGKLINVPLGYDISPEICPWIEKSIEEKNELCDLLQEAINHLGEVKWEDHQTETLGNFSMNAQAAIFRIKNNAQK